MEKGIANDKVTIDVWNDKGGGSGSDEAISPKINAVNGVDDASVIFDGTTLNGFVSMLEARSCKAYGVAADSQTSWTPIGPSDLLSLGNMPSNTKRTIEIRLNVPLDAPNLATINFELKIFS